MKCAGFGLAGDCGKNTRERPSFGLAHDVLRHSFFSYVVGAKKSVERAALEGGNTESILRRHYLNLTTTDEAEDFWRIVLPGADEVRKVVKMTARRCTQRH